jgi:SRSO17 transposase
LALRLYLPESWTQDAKRLNEAKVPQEHQAFKTKHQIALELLDQARSEEIPAKAVVVDAGYGSSEFRKGLDDRDLLYVMGAKGDEVVFASEPQWVLLERRSNGRPASRPRLASNCSRPVTVAELARSLALRRCTWREGTKGKLFARFARVRVWPAHCWTKGKCADEGPLWLLIEERGDELRYAFSNLPEGTPLIQLVRLLKSRWPVEQGYQQMKEELGLDHFEGRRWYGFHHHACLVFLAFGFLELERLRMTRVRRRSREKNGKTESNPASSTSGPPGSAATGSQLRMPILSPKTNVG